MHEAKATFIWADSGCVAQRGAASPLTMKVRSSLFFSLSILIHDTSTGECRPTMIEYLACLKRARGMNDPECRLLAKAYLKCRMDRSVDLSPLSIYIPLGVLRREEKKKNNRKVREFKLCRLICDN